MGLGALYGELRLGADVGLASLRLDIDWALGVYQTQARPDGFCRTSGNRTRKDADALVAMPAHLTAADPLEVAPRLVADHIAAGPLQGLPGQQAEPRLGRNSNYGGRTVGQAAISSRDVFVVDVL